MRSDTLENWDENEDVVLLRGEIAIAFDSNGHSYIKIGDGVRSWKELGFVGFEMNAPVKTQELRTTVDENEYMKVMGW